MTTQTSPTCIYCEAAPAVVFLVCAGDPASDYSGPACSACSACGVGDYTETL